MKRRLSDSSSSSSEDEKPSFGSSTHHGFDVIQARDDLGSPISDNSLESPKITENLDDDADSSPKLPSKKRRLVDDKAKRMMEKMGYKTGVGLGKHGQGRLEPIEASQQKGRRGLGHYNEKLKDANLRWDSDKEVVSIVEEINWLDNVQEPVESKLLDHWMSLGPTKKTIDDECTFCDLNVVMQVVNSKSVFDNLDKNEMRRARTRSNPYETIRGVFFLNRAAVKMANMDKACNFMFTQPESLKNGELLYFADVCAGPGGFSEYVLWRKQWHAKGFGFTLKASNDFKLDDFYAGPPETFHPYYGPRGDGDVYSPENQEAFRDLIMQQTKGEGVHFMMADGGFSVEGQESIQEILSKRLYLCQCLVALMIVRTGGNFVTKLFDIFTPFSAGLVYLMYRCFEHVSIFKPNTSRPANSERYLICKGKRANVNDVVEYLARANRVIGEDNASRDVMELVPLDIMQEDSKFFEYLKESNETLGKKQVVGLLKIAAFCEDMTLFESRQADIRKQCLEHWKLPDQIRTIPRDTGPSDQLNAIMRLHKATLEFMSSKSTELTKENLDSTIFNTPHDWFCIPCGSGQTNDKSGQATFYIGLGGTKTFQYSKGSWIRVHDVELPPDTLVYAEMIHELRGEHMRQRKTSALHIIDAFMLGKENVSSKYLEERHALTKKFCEALWKPINNGNNSDNRPVYMRVRAKELHYLPNNLSKKLSLRSSVMKNGRNVAAYTPSSSSTSYENDGDEPYYFVPNSLLFIKGTARNWARHVSRSRGLTYWFNCKDGRTLFDGERPATAHSNFPESFENRAIWSSSSTTKVTIGDLLRIIQEKCPTR